MSRSDSQQGGDQAKPSIADSTTLPAGMSTFIAAETHTPEAKKLADLERELMLARSSVSGLSSLQDPTNVRKHAEGSSLRACLLLIVKQKIDARPELVTARRKRRASAVTVDYITTRQAVDQMLSMASVQAVGTRGVGGRVSGRFVRFNGHREARRTVGFPEEEALSAMYRSFTMLNGTVSTRLLLERYIDDTGLVWFILRRTSAEKTIQVAQRSLQLFGGSRTHTLERLNRSTVAVDAIPGLPAEPPVYMRWTALGAAVHPAGAVDADTDGRLTLSFPVCVIDDEALDLHVQ